MSRWRTGSRGLMSETARWRERSGCSPCDRAGAPLAASIGPGKKTGRLDALSSKLTWRRGSESNRRMQLLQSRALPLGYPAAELTPKNYRPSHPRFNQFLPQHASQNLDKAFSSHETPGVNGAGAEENGRKRTQKAQRGNLFYPGSQHSISTNICAGKQNLQGVSHEPSETSEEFRTTT